MRRSIGRILVAGAAAALAIGLGVSPALAEPAPVNLTVVVTAGGTYAAASTRAALTDGAVTVTCTGSAATGRIPTSTYSSAPSPVRVGKVSTLNFTGCTSPLGVAHITVTLSPVYPVKVDSTTNIGGQTNVMVTGVNLALSMSGCTFDVTGSAPGYYTNSSHTLALVPASSLPLTPLNTATLTVSNVTGCVGVIHNGDNATLTSSYLLSRAIVIS